MTIPEYIASQLSINGVRYVFGIPGGPSIPYIEAFRKAGIEFILTSNETAAGIMADVTGRLTGIPGICHATFGPGATNISTGIGGALLDRSPVIVFTSEMGTKMINRTTQMNIDHQKLFEPLTKATFRVNETNIKEVLQKAFRISTDIYPGPVHIGLPSDIAETETDYLPDTEYLVPGEPSYNNSESAEAIITLLENCRSPLIALGLTAARSNIRQKLLLLLEIHKIAVVLSPMAKGLLPEDHQCYAGVLFHSLSDYLEEIFEKTDLVIALGYDPVEFNYESWMPDVPLIHFDQKIIDMPQSGKIFQYAGKPAEWFDILEHLDRSTINPGLSIIEGIRNEMWAVFEGFTNHFGPAAALKAIQDELPGDAIVTADVGSHLHLIGQFWNTGNKGKLIMTNGWSGMGFGIPAAIAAQLDNRDATVVCITGDGGFLMTAGELITARRYNLPIIVIVFSDGELNLIKVKQSWKNISPYGTILYQDDLFGSDHFLGMKVLSADSGDTMQKALIKALSVNEPVIINAVIDPEDYQWLIVRR
ncbi:MAG TPA: thiamine pyrophosphate-binding protein [Bacteroidales bacterium]|nr:thiamine pyrophosphate-binding protein [Bacteroidales bacterium]